MLLKVFRRRFSNIIRKRNVWTDDKVILSPFRDVQIPNMTVFEYVFRNLEQWPTKPAVVCGLTNREYTYEQVYKKSKILGANLRKKIKIDNGDTVALIHPNSPEYAVAVFGVLTAGGIVTPINPVYTPYKIQKQIDSSDAKLIIAHPDLVPNTKRALELSKKNLKIISVNVDKDHPEGTISYKELVEDNVVDLSILKEVNRLHGDVAFLPYSSGTTGLPKAVELTHRNIIANCQQQNTEFRQYQFTTENHQDTSLAILPLFHSYGLGIQMLHKMSAGLKLVTLPRFQPDSLLKVLLTHEINLMYLAPPMVLFLGSSPDVTGKHLQYVNAVTSGAAPLPPADIQKLLNKTKRDIGFCQGYGMTEASPLVSLSLPGEKYYEEVGYAIPNMSLRVVDSELKNLGPGEFGELLVKGPNVMRGYKDNPKANEDVFIGDGWLRTGDMAKVDESGRITIVDRLKELIKVKGFQVPPAELENVLKEHPDVFDAAVVGIPEPTTGEMPKAYIVLKQGANTTDSDIMNFVSERVAPYKRIKEVSFIDNIPKNPSGKILRKLLREN